jgi:hypothetical protein
LAISKNCRNLAYGENQGESTPFAAFRELLTSLVRQEVKNLPRGIQHSSMRRQNTLTPVGKAINGIPGLLQTKYEKVKNPGLRPSLAGMSNEM